MNRRKSSARWAGGSSPCCRRRTRPASRITRDILYPKNWLEVISRRGGIEGSGVDMGFELNRMLDTVQPEINFDDQPFDQAVDFLREISQIKHRRRLAGPRQQRDRA